MTSVPDFKSLLSCCGDSTGLPDLQYHGIQTDSRQIEQGDVFFALVGNQHGLCHAADALHRGAKAIVYDPAHEGEELAMRLNVSAPLLVLPELTGNFGKIAAHFHGDPSRHLDLIGITGTNGKTSCSHFIAQALIPRRQSAIVGTLGWGIPGQTLQTSQNTTPGPLQINAILASLLQRGAQTVAMEVSSHGLHQGRINGLHFKGALFTNITRDHLDYHGSMEAYIETKLEFARWPDLSFVAVNLNDPHTARVLEQAPPHCELWGFGRNPLAMPHLDLHQIYATAIQPTTQGFRFDVSYRDSKASIAIPLLGDFNVDNALATITVLLALGYDLQDCAAMLRNIRSVAGRMECYGGQHNQTLAVVDYAHTPDALERVLSSLRPHCKGNLWVVFGCGGNRDRGKRPQMGEISTRLADRVILTDDNPRHEDGDHIIADILSGCIKAKPTVVRDRYSAIMQALADADPLDIVLIAGKGHEQNQEIAGIHHPFCDREVVQSFIRDKELS